MTKTKKKTIKEKILKRFRTTFPIGKKQYIVDEATYNPKLIMFLSSALNEMERETLKEEG